MTLRRVPSPDREERGSRPLQDPALEAFAHVVAGMLVERYYARRVATRSDDTTKGIDTTTSGAKIDTP